jgi:hypothetical protein
LFPKIFAKPAVVQFDHRQGSSDGGAILLKSADSSYRLVPSLARCLEDNRQAGKVDHSLQQLLAQRVFSIACRYPDGNDSARLGADPVHKMLLDRDPVNGLDLASQPTLSRFENAVGAKELYRMGESLALSVLERHRKRLRGKPYPKIQPPLQLATPSILLAMQQSPSEHRCQHILAKRIVQNNTGRSFTNNAG